MRREGRIAGAMMGLAALALAGASAAQGASEEFTPDERRRLLAGELVRRPQDVTEGRNHYVGGASWQRVDAPLEQVWERVLDVGAYPRLIPGVEEARVVEDDPPRRVIYLRHSYAVVRAGYHVIATVEPDAHSVRFDLDRTRPRDIRDGRGFLRVHRLGPDRSVVAWGVRADVGNSLVTGVFGGLLRDWILRVPWCVQQSFIPGAPGC